MNGDARRRYGLWCLVCILMLGLPAACSSGSEQPRIAPLAQSDAFENYQSARPLPAQAIARPHAGSEGSADAAQAEPFQTGLEAGEPLASVPITVTESVLARGEERYAIYCAPCHGAAGEGDGLVVQHGFPAPPSLHTPALRDTPAGTLFQIITHGRGAMFGYAARVEPADRWAIVAYMRTLQEEGIAYPDETRSDAQ